MNRPCYMLPLLRSRSSTSIFAHTIPSSAFIKATSKPFIHPQQAATQSLTTMNSNHAAGFKLQNGCQITHGTGAHVKKPFADMDLTMHELVTQSDKGFAGQLGFIEFNTDCRLPRHIHIDINKNKLIDERILVLHGTGMVEIAGSLFVVAPGSLVDAIGGVPHTWTACPPGVELPDGTVSSGTFTMVYEYEEPTHFFPTASTEPILDVSEFKEFTGKLDDIRFPKLSAQEVVDKGCIVFNTEMLKVKLASTTSTAK